jgi:hypothetical protein
MGVAAFRLIATTVSSNQLTESRRGDMLTVMALLI